MKQNLLITGSCGFIASNLIRKIFYDQLQYNVFSLDKINDQVMNSMVFNKSNSFHIADINDHYIVNRIFQYTQPDIVIHTASEKSSDSILSTNVIGTKSILDACVKNNVKKIVYLSSAEVYGDAENSDESSVTNPSELYGISKLTAEKTIQMYSKYFGLNYQILRLSNVYGPRQTVDKFIPKIIKSIMQKQPITVYGDGSHLREWTNVADINNGILSIINNGKLNDIYNISSNQETSNLELVQRVCNSMNEGFELIKHIDDPRKIHNKKQSLNSSKIRELGWKPEYKFKEGVSRTIKWYLSNQWILK